MEAETGGSASVSRCRLAAHGPEKLRTIEEGSAWFAGCPQAVPSAKCLAALVRIDDFSGSAGKRRTADRLAWP